MGLGPPLKVLTRRYINVNVQYDYTYSTRAGYTFSPFGNSTGISHHRPTIVMETSLFLLISASNTIVTISHKQCRPNHNNALRIPYCVEDG